MDKPIRCLDAPSRGNYTMFAGTFLVLCLISSPSCLQAPFFKSHLPNKNSLTQGNTTHPATMLNGFSTGPSHKVMSAIFWSTGEKHWDWKLGTPQYFRCFSETMRLNKEQVKFSLSQMFLLSKRPNKSFQRSQQCLKVSTGVSTHYTLKNRGLFIGINGSSLNL